MADALKLDKARAIECLCSMVRGTENVIGSIEEVGMRVEAFRLAYTTVERDELPVVVQIAIRRGISFDKDVRRLRMLLAARSAEQVLREGESDAVIAKVAAVRTPPWDDVSMSWVYRNLFLTRSPELFAAAPLVPDECQAPRSPWTASAPAPRRSIWRGLRR